MSHETAAVRGMGNDLESLLCVVSTCRITRHLLQLQPVENRLTLCMLIVFSMGTWVASLAGLDTSLDRYLLAFESQLTQDEIMKTYAAKDSLFTYDGRKIHARSYKHRGVCFRVAGFRPLEKSRSHPEPLKTDLRV